LRYWSQGGRLAGRAVAPGRALIVSEEAASDWDARRRRLTLGPHVQFLCRPFRGARPTDAQWLALVAGLEALHRQEALDLVVLDALATLLPGYAETSAGEPALEPRPLLKIGTSRGDFAAGKSPTPGGP